MPRRRAVCNDMQKAYEDSQTVEPGLSNESKIAHRAADDENACGVQLDV